MKANEILGFNPEQLLKYAEGECINYDNTEIDEIDDCSNILYKDIKMINL